MCLAAAGGYWLVRRALIPVARIVNAAEALTFNSPHKRLPLAGTHELDELVITLNRMLDRLDNAYQHANRFSADAAHELRTPLAIMRGELEFIAARPDLAAEVAAGAGNALDETLRLGQLVENLMNLAVIEGDRRKARAPPGRSARAGDGDHRTDETAGRRQEYRARRHGGSDPWWFSAITIGSNKPSSI